MVPDPADNTFPGNDEVIADPGAHVGERMAVGGTVVDTDPAVVRLENGFGGHEGAVAGLEPPAVSTSDRLSAFGTLTGTGTVEAERTIVRERWELAYMYGVSFLCGLVVLGRLGVGWRLDRERWALLPRTGAGASSGGERSATNAGDGGDHA